MGLGELERMLPEPNLIGKYFYEQYKIFPEQPKKRCDWKKLKAGHLVKVKEKKKAKSEACSELSLLGAPPEVELASNASNFAVFASVRLAVLDRWMKQACQIYLNSSASSPHDFATSDIESDSEENSEKTKENIPLKLPKIVGVGLRSVFELIRESRSSHPTLCTKALSALLDVLQGQQPEELKGEPSHVIDPLFDLLLDLATSHGPESAAANDGSHLTAVACACLLSLVVVRGDTGKLLSATAALLMCPRALASQNIHLPAVLVSLQRSVHTVLLGGKSQRPDWLTHGVPRNARHDSFHLRLPSDLHGSIFEVRSLASNGRFLFLYTSKGLLKIGSGYGGTVKGHIYMVKADLVADNQGWLGFANGQLYLRLLSKKGCEILCLDMESLTVNNVYKLEGKEWSRGVLFADGDSLGLIVADKDDGFVVREVQPSSKPALISGSELPLKLARKCIDVFGHGGQPDDESCSQALRKGNGAGLDGEEIMIVCAGKEFTLVRTSTGKVLFSGKPASLGIKQPQKAGRWCELPIPKSPKINHIFVGHEGLHAILISEDGGVWFVGTARRGEDGDASGGKAARRQPKPAKPRRIIKVEGNQIVTAACNNGTTALVSREGELLLFGKDTTHCDNSSGQVTLLKGINITQVSLGKAHAIALTSSGQVYTFGINNKGQCGRDFAAPPSQAKEVQSITAMETTAEDEEEVSGIPSTSVCPGEGIEWTLGEGSGPSVRQQFPMCSPGKHSWKHDQCMVCTVCRECTGYSISCLSSMHPGRNPGQECGCGEGDSGCAECGCCRICAKENVDNSDLALLGPSGAGDLAGMMRLDLIFGGRHGARLQDHLQRRLDERKHRQQRSGGVGGSSSSKPGLKMKPSLTRGGASKAASPLHRTTIIAASGSSNIQTSAPIVEESSTAGGSDPDRGDPSRVTSLPPALLILPSTESPVIQISSGLHHTAILTKSGQVFTFGSNAYGQLGVGDVLPRAGPSLVVLPSPAIQIACGSNHTVILMRNGEIYTFGSYQKGQLGRCSSFNEESSSNFGINSECELPVNNILHEGEGCNNVMWFSIPQPVLGIGPAHGRRATWIGASADQTFVKLDESLINAVSLTRSTVMANRSCILLLPTQTDLSVGFKCLAIAKSDGTCASFTGPDQADFARSVTCLDPLYSVLWSFQPSNGEMSCFNIVGSDVFNNIKNNSSLSSTSTSILSPELALPEIPSCFVTRSHAALHLLGCLDTLTREQTISDIRNGKALTLRGDQILNPLAGKRSGIGKVYSREDFSAVTRFESHGGGWGYSGHSIEAIRFMADTDILLGGFGLFGGRGEYTGKIKVFDIGLEGGEQETDGEVLAETEEIPYECGPRQKYAMLFDEPLSLQANRWYVAWARVSGPSSDCGASGQGMVTTDDQVIFYFKSSKKSNNGTDVNAGQIPQLLYRVITGEREIPRTVINSRDPPVHRLSREFSRSVTSECFNACCTLLQWSWNTFKAALVDVGSSGHNLHAALLDLERLVFISRASLRLLTGYTNEIYPNQGLRQIPTESPALAESIGDVRALLQQILSDAAPRGSGKVVRGAHRGARLASTILDECHSTFVECYHALYPTAWLKWTCLCYLLHTQSENDRVLSAVLAALCSPTVRLRSTFPILSGGWPDANDGIGTLNLTAESASDVTIAAASQNTNPEISTPSSSPHRYPLLVEHLTHRTQMEFGNNLVNWTFREVLERLLDVVTAPVRQALLNERVSRSPELVRHCCHLLARVVAELAGQSSGTDEEAGGACGRVLHATPSRFTRTNQSRSWNTGNGSPDAICFSVDRPGLVVAGVSLYGGLGTYEYELELLDDTSGGGGGNEGCAGNTSGQRWNSLEVVRGTYSPDDCSPNDIAEVRFERPVPIKECVKYAIRLRNHGGRTSNGDGGLGSVKGPDGSTWTFSTCSLSFNGTTQTRGQIPSILYYSNPGDCEAAAAAKAFAELHAARCTLTLTSSIVQRAADLLSLGRQRCHNMNDEDTNFHSHAIYACRILSHACLVTTLLPLVLAHISPLATLDPRSAVQVLNLIQELLPHVAALNLIAGPGSMIESPNSVEPNLASNTPQTSTTTSHHYAWVESEHPYKPATVANYSVSFPETVKWMAIEFDPRCGTAQAEDSLQISIPRMENSKIENDDESDVKDDVHIQIGSPLFWPVLHRFSQASQNWPQSALVLPGHEVMFSLETASDYIKDERACTFGFRCLVIGYEWQQIPGDGLRQLESELSFLGGMAAASLLSKDLVLPPTSAEEMDEDIDAMEELAQQIFAANSSLLAKGFALAASPSISQALDGALPFSCHSNERQFLKDMVSCTPGTSGGRLARWLQPEPRVEPFKCHITCRGGEDLRCGWPAHITIATNDQYGEPVHVSSLKVVVRAEPLDVAEGGAGTTLGSRKIRRVVGQQPDAMTFGGHAQPSLTQPYELTVKEHMRYYAITLMKAYENYSFEELRFTAPAPKRASETMLVRANGDGTYAATWTPGSVGWYAVRATVDGYEIDQVCRVEAKEPPQGLAPPVQSSLARKAPHQPSRLRRFVARNSAGLRIRAHPSLQSEQIGIVHVNGTIAFVDEVHNDDGVWLRLSQDTISQYCGSGGGNSTSGNSIGIGSALAVGTGSGVGSGGGSSGNLPLEAWCLQYNQHLGKTLLLPVDEPKSILDQLIRDTILRKCSETANTSSGSSTDPSIHPRSPNYFTPGQYEVVKCGASGHNVRSEPNLKAPPVGMLVLGNHITVLNHVTNSEGTWVQLDRDTMTKYCFNNDGEAWSLALSRGDIIYLRKHPPTEPEASALEVHPQIPETSSPSIFGSNKRTQNGFDFGGPSTPPTFNFGSKENIDTTSSFIFGNRPSVTIGNTLNTFSSPQNSQSIVNLSVKEPPPQQQQQQQPPQTPPSSSSPGSFVFGLFSSHENKEKSPKSKDSSNIPASSVKNDGSRFAALSKWLKGEETGRPPRTSSGPSDLPPELAGVSVKELVKAIGESRANGNGVTPPGTRSSSPRLSRSSSPVAIPAATTLGKHTTLLHISSTVPGVPSQQPGRGASAKHIFGNSVGSSSQAGASSRSIGISPLVSGGATAASTAPGGPATAASASAVAAAGESLQPSPTSHSDTSALVSSLTHDLSQTSTASSSLQLRSENSPNDCFGSPSRNDQLVQTGTQTSPEQTTTATTTGIKSHFCIGSSGKDEHRISPKLGGRKSRLGGSNFLGASSGGSLGGGSGGSSKRAISPIPPVNTPQQANSQVGVQTHAKNPVKQAVSPSVAECVRAVFAAFLWHEGIVHDAMACASFLKFHPNLPKQGALVVTRQPSNTTTVSGDTTGFSGVDGIGTIDVSQLTKEQRARQRHSVEVSTAGNYLHIQPSTLEALTRSAANANANRNRNKKLAAAAAAAAAAASGSDAIREEGGPEGTSILPQTVSVLPPALKALVVLWEELNQECAGALEQPGQTFLTSPSQPVLVNRGSTNTRTVRHKDYELGKKTGKKKKPGQNIQDSLEKSLQVQVGETVCELCGHIYPHPVTYHMRQAHPGCGGHSGGKGYNSGGNFCLGWAGSCGDGGVGGSSWYLVCDTCREKYLKSKRGSGIVSNSGNIVGGNRRSGVKNRRSLGKSGVSTLTMPPTSQEPHIIIKNNAMFLLELASAAEGLPSGHHSLNQRRGSSHFIMPSVAEHRWNDSGNAFPSNGPLQCLQAFGITHNHSVNSSSSSSDHHSSLIEAPIRTGILVHHARPVSETAVSDSESDGGKGRPFHRSISMGTNGGGWARRSDCAEGPRIILSRKKNTSHNEVNGGGSSLLCHPSASLQRLVPSLDQSAIISGPAELQPRGGELLSRPVLIFLLQQHNLDALRLAMRQALRKASCRTHAMQALNWLLRSVTQPTCLHDLLWWFVSSLTPASPSMATGSGDHNPITDVEVIPPTAADITREEDEEAGLGIALVASSAGNNSGNAGGAGKLIKQERKDDHEIRWACDHPLSDIGVAGDSVHPLPAAFHTLLQTIADLMLLLPMGSPLQQMAVRCWGIRFTQRDHTFLHRSHVFSNISKILSRSEEEGEDISLSLHESHHSILSQITSHVEVLKDLTPSVELKASSRQAMIASLTDSSTETFWESGDEDRNKTKTLTIQCPSAYRPRAIYIHVDNGRDLANKVSHITFQSGPNAEELFRIRTIEVENRSAGWIGCHIPDDRHLTLRLELKGPDNSLRLRQVRILGAAPTAPLPMGGSSSGVIPIADIKHQHPASLIQHRNCEAETLRVFRLITSQVFGKLILGEEEGTLPEIIDQPQEANDLKEHMVGILFSRSKLTHLQKQVCAHIVQAIRKEATRVRDEWETLLCSAIPPSQNTSSTPINGGPQVSSNNSGLSNSGVSPAVDAYCFEMLSMVLALSGSAVGRTYLAAQHGLLRDLLTLLHAGSPRVQRQVTSLLRRMLPEVTPSNLCGVLGVDRLPPSDFSIAPPPPPPTPTSNSENLSKLKEPEFDPNRLGILDVLLACIAKALTVQVKVKTKEEGGLGNSTGGNNSGGKGGITTVTLATSIHPRDELGARWWLRGCISRKLAEVVIQLVKDMASGILTESWARVTKAAVADAILNLTRLNEIDRQPTRCLHTPTLWLALASLCCLDTDHVERLSSGQWGGATTTTSVSASTSDNHNPPPRPTCANHDDCETPAVVQCQQCGSLCVECDRVLHLPRRSRHHSRHVCKEEEDAIRVDLHEGCGRTKLFWLLALADSSTLKALVEFREGAARNKPSGVSTGICRFCGATGSTGLLAIGNVCADHECQEHARQACSRVHPCGHVCGGLSGESPDCLPCLHGCAGLSSLKQDADDMCMICFTEALSAQPSIQLACGHVFHAQCCRIALTKRWTGPRITFAFAQCPICKADMRHPVLDELLSPICELREDVRRKALMRLEYEGLDRADAITTRFRGDPASYALDRYAYYVCSRCGKAYYGGEARCDVELAGAEFDPAELVCGACSDVSRAQMCPKHGTDFLEYKCRYCCSVAVFFCFGTTHFCNACHDDFQRVTNIPRQELPVCPAGPKAKQLVGDECPLHVKHPPTGEEFALGCGVCRNAHTF